MTSKAARLVMLSGFWETVKRRSRRLSEEIAKSYYFMQVHGGGLLVSADKSVLDGGILLLLAG